MCYLTQSYYSLLLQRKKKCGLNGEYNILNSFIKQQKI